MAGPTGWFDSLRRCQYLICPVMTYLTYTQNVPTRSGQLGLLLCRDIYVAYFIRRHQFILQSVLTINAKLGPYWWSGMFSPLNVSLIDLMIEEFICTGTGTVS